MSLITSNKLITLFKPYQRSRGSPRRVFGGEGGCVCRLAPQVRGGSLELSYLLSSIPLLWRWPHLRGRCNLCGENHFETTLIQALQFPMLFVSGGGLMKQKREPLGCTWAVTWFCTAHDFSSTSLDDTQAHRVCDLEIKILSVSGQKCLQGLSRRRFPCLLWSHLYKFSGFARKDDLFSSCWMGGCVGPCVKPGCLS